MILGYLTSEIHGLFTINHLLAFCLCVTIVTLLIVFTIKMPRKKLDIVFIIIAAIEIIGELIKQGFNDLLFKEDIKAIFPLFYCSLLLYLVIPLFFVKDEKIKDKIYGLIMYYGLIPSLTYIFVPVSAINNHPLISFPTLHGLVYHSLMLYLSLIIAIRKIHIVDKKDLTLYACVTITFCSVVSLINVLANANFMFTNFPVGGVKLLDDIYDTVGPLVYCYGVIVGQTLGSYLLAYYFYKFLQKKVKIKE